VTETSTRRVSLAIWVVDELSSVGVTDAHVYLRGIHQAPVRKREGFYVFSDLSAGGCEIGIRSVLFRPFIHVFQLPLPTEDHLVLRVPGENEVILVVREVIDADAQIIRFVAQDFRDALPAGSRVVCSKGETLLAGRGIPAGEGVDTATLQDIAWGTEPLGSGDLIRVLREPAVPLRPGPLYPFQSALRRVTGTVRDALTGGSIGAATIRLTGIGEGIGEERLANNLAYEDVGTTPDNRARVYTVGDDEAKRVIGTEHSVSCTATTRGRYAFYFPERPDLSVDEVTLVAEAPGYVIGSAVQIDLSAHPRAEQALELMPL
jgi:hypothetical protein